MPISVITQLLPFIDKGLEDNIEDNYYHFLFKNWRLTAADAQGLLSEFIRKGI